MEVLPILPFPKRTTPVKDQGYVLAFASPFSRVTLRRGCLCIGIILHGLVYKGAESLRLSFMSLHGELCLV